MRDRQSTPDTKSQHSQPTKEREAQRATAQEDVLATQQDPLTQAISRIGSAPSAKVHASLLSRATSDYPARGRQLMLQMQRQYGNRYVQRVMELSRQGEGEAEATPEVEAAIEQARGGGRSLDSGIQRQMESAFGTNFSGVRVHTDSTADALNQSLSARAFTTGQDIFFRQGEYNPGSSSGKELLAHELTHVVQQTGTVRGKMAIGQPGDAYEQEADQVAKAVMQMEQTPSNDESNTVPILTGHTPQSKVLKHLQTLQKTTDHNNPTLYRKAINEFQQGISSGEITGLQRQIVESTSTVGVHQKDSSQTLRRSLEGCTPSRGCSASATGISLGASSAFNDGTDHGLITPIIVRGTNLADVLDSELVSPSVDHHGSFATIPSVVSGTSGFMPANSIPPDRHLANNAWTLSVFDGHGGDGDLSFLQMDLFTIPTCGINTPQDMPNSGYRIKRTVKQEGTKVVGIVEKTAEAVTIGSHSSTPGLTAKKEAKVTLRN